MTTEPIDIAKWIEDEKLPWPTGDFKLQGCTIAQCIPPAFESYCKIFHPFEVTKVISWKSVAEKYGLIFHNEINPQTFLNKFQQIGKPENLNFPSEGYLPRQLLVKLLKSLKEVSTSDLVYIYQMPPHNVWKDIKNCDLVKCSFDEVLEYFDDDFIGYLYSSDKSWIVFTDSDLAFTMVGGQKKLTDILISSELEVLECLVSTRVDNYSDKINVEQATHNSTLPKVGLNWWKKLFGS